MTAVAEQTLPEARAPEQTGAAADQTRRCLVTGALLPKEDLIRFVLDPDHHVVPDLAGNLPGRGLWVTASAQAITEAVRKNLFAKAAKDQAKVSADLLERTVQLMRRRVLDLIGLARSAGIATLGQPQVEAALKARRVAFLCLADDAGAEPGHSTGVPSCRFLTRSELGAALGYEQIVYVGFAAHGLTQKLTLEAGRLASLLALSTTNTTPIGKSRND